MFIYHNVELDGRLSESDSEIGGALGSGEPAGEELDAGDHQPGQGALEGGLEVLGQAAIAVEPGYGPLDHPPARQHFEAFGGIDATDDLQPPRAKPGERFLELGARIGAIGRSEERRVGKECRSRWSP